MEVDDDDYYYYDDDEDDEEKEEVHDERMNGWMEDDDCRTMCSFILIMSDVKEHVYLHRNAMFCFRGLYVFWHGGFTFAFTMPFP